MNLKQQRTLVIGLGKCGCLAVNHLSNQPSTSALAIDCILFDCDRELLNALVDSKSKKILIGKEQTKGLGCGEDLSKGEEIIDAYKNQFIEELQSYHRVIIFGSLNGGFSGGLMRKLPSYLAELDKLIFFVGTKPFGIEGEKKRLCAERTAKTILARKGVLISLDYNLSYCHLPLTTQLDVAHKKTRAYFCNALVGLTTLLRFSSDDLAIEAVTINNALNSVGTEAALSYAFHRSNKVDEEEFKVICSKIVNEIRSNPFSGGIDFINKSTNVFMRISTINFTIEQITFLMQKIREELKLEDRITFGHSAISNESEDLLKVSISALFVAAPCKDIRKDGLLGSIFTYSNLLSNSIFYSYKKNTFDEKENLDEPTWMRRGVQIDQEIY